MVTLLSGARESDSKEVGDLAYEISIGKGMKFGFKFNFVLPGSAEINKIVNL